MRSRNSSSLYLIASDVAKPWSAFSAMYRAANTANAPWLARVNGERNGARKRGPFLSALGDPFPKLSFQSRK